MEKFEKSELTKLADIIDSTEYERLRGIKERLINH